MIGAIGPKDQLQAPPAADSTTKGNLPAAVADPATTATLMPTLDQTTIVNAKPATNPQPVSLMSEEIPAAKPQVLTATATKPKAENPWGIRSVNVHYAPMLTSYAPSTMHFKQADYGTDLTIHDVHATQRTSFSAFYNWPAGYLQIDEPQASTSIAVEANNGYGLEANIKHNKYIIPDIAQERQFTGTVGGQPIDKTQALGKYLDQYEICTGLNEVSIEATHSFKLPTLSPKDRFELISKAGPSVYVNNPRSRTVAPDGQVEVQPDGKYRVGGYGATVENELRYEFRQHLSLSVSHSVSWANLTNVPIPHGTATQQIWANQFDVGLGYTINTHRKHKAPGE